MSKITIDLSNVTTEAEFNTQLQNAISELSTLDLFFRTRLVDGLKALNSGVQNKGRIAVPDFMKKAKPVSQGNGKKGRPALTPEQKIEAEKKRFEAKVAKLQDEASSEAV